MNDSTPIAPIDCTDPLYSQARQIVLDAQWPSISLIQRRLRIGYRHARGLRAAMLGDILEHCPASDTWSLKADGSNLGHSPVQQKLVQAAQWIREAKSLVIAAGAGMGVDSGMPDFRSHNGFWRSYPALARGRIRFEDAASPMMFERQPSLAWGFYGHRLTLYRRLMPHTGFAHLKNWCDAMPDGSFVFTSNVDGHFQKAGFATNRIHECHGSIHHLQCTQFCSRHIWDAEDFQPEVDEENCRLLHEAPHCPHCGALARPNILMFNDWSWNNSRSDLQMQRLDLWLDGVSAPPLVLEIGAGRAVATVRHFSQRMKQRGSRLIRINLHEANIHNPQDIEIPLGAQDALEHIAHLLQ